MMSGFDLLELPEDRGLQLEIWSLFGGEHATLAAFRREPWRDRCILTAIASDTVEHMVLTLPEGAGCDVEITGLRHRYLKVDRVMVLLECLRSCNDLSAPFTVKRSGNVGASGAGWTDMVCTEVAPVGDFSRCFLSFPEVPGERAECVCSKEVVEVVRECLDGLIGERYVGRAPVDGESAAEFLAGALAGL